MKTEYIITRKVEEAPDIISFYLRRADGAVLPYFRPGKYLQLEIERVSKNIIRNYTLSDSPGKEYYRITIKKEERGVASSALYAYEIGDIIRGSIELMGDCFLADNNVKPLVLLSAGIGITPMLSIVNYLTAREDQREVWFIHSAKKFYPPNPERTFARN